MTSLELRFFFELSKRIFCKFRKILCKHRPLCLLITIRYYLDVRRWNFIYPNQISIEIVLNFILLNIL